MFWPVSVTIVLILSFWSWFKWRYTYFDRKKIPSYPNPKIPFGNAQSPFNPQLTVGDQGEICYREMKAKGHKHFGLFFGWRPLYFPIDLEYIKNILLKDFNYFTDKGLYYNEETDPLSAHLFFLGGIKWRNLRSKLSPTFSSGKLKLMFDTLVQAGSHLYDAMENFYVKKEPIDIKEVAARFTTDIIGSCAFGLECNSFKEEHAPFRYYGNKAVEVFKTHAIKFNFAYSCGGLAKRLGMALTPKDSTDFFMGVVRDAIDYRRRNKTSRNDFLQLIMDLNTDENKHLHDGKSLTFEETAAQCFVFFVGGFETGSTTLSFFFMEIAQHLDIQEKIREEINRVLKKYNGKITYDGINEMKYMHQAVEETLRLYPPVQFISRECVKDYKVPDTDIIIEKGTFVGISAQGLHYDPEYFPNPQQFDPDRFSEENKQKIKPFSYLPFGEGPRLCIGMRFGLMQVKVAITLLLQKYRFTLSSKTQMPIKKCKIGMIPSVEGGIWLDCEKV